jgi:NTP pyrophosphatase (non-canonical NTP hydrolase)
MERPKVSDDALLKAIEAATVALGQKIEKHGTGAYISSHESLGIITEEYFELMDAVKQNDPIETGNELMDVAVGCIFALASMIQKDMDLRAAKASK